MDNRRKYSRIPVRLRIKISHPSIGEKIVHSRDLSEGGLFVVVDPTDLPEEGNIVKGQVLDTEEEAPTVDMKIVRVGQNGLALEYVTE